MGVKERYEERQKNGEKNSYSGVRERSVAKEIDGVASSITNRVNTWLENHNNYITNYQTRNSGRKYNYEDSYVSDSADWLNTISKQRSNFSAEADSILAQLDQYKGYFNDEWVESVRKTLTDARSAQDIILENSTKDNEWWSSFGNEELVNAFGSAEDAYKYYQRSDGYRKKYSGQTYTDLQNTLSGLEKGEEYDWLNSYAASVDYDEKSKLDLETSQREIAAMESALEVYKASTRFETDDKGKEMVEHIRQQYGIQSEQELEALISQKRTYLTQAQRIQDGIKLAGVADSTSEYYDPTFFKYTGYVDDGKTPLIPDYKDVVYDVINNNGDTSKIATGQAWNRITGSEMAKLDAVKKMTDDERAIYNYYYSKHGYDAAEEYLDSIVETLYGRSALELYQPMEGKTALEMVFGIAAGLDQATSGIKSLFSSDDYIPASPIQQASGLVRDDLEEVGPKLPDWMGGASIGQGAYDAITTTANMVPSIMLSIAVGAVNPVAGTVVGNLTMGASAAGNAYQEALNLGYDKGQARTYSTLVGASEVGLQYLMGGIGKLGGKLSGKAAASLASKFDSAFARLAVKYGTNMLSEGAEEYLQEILTPVFKNFALKTDEEISLISEDAIYSFLLGAITSGVMEGGSTISTALDMRSGKKANVDAATMYGDFTGDLIQEGLASDIGSESHQLAEIAKRKTDKGKSMSGYEIRQLVKANEAQFSVENYNDAVSTAKDRLTELGESKDVDKIAKLAAKRATGQELTSSEKSTLARSQFGAQVAKEMSTPTVETQNGTKIYNATYKSLEDRVGTEGRFGVSENGQATIRETNEVIDIGTLDVATVGDGQMTFKVAEDREVYAGDIDFADEDQSFLVSAVSDIENITPAAATAIMHDVVDTSKPLGAQLNGIDEAYTYGYNGYSVEDMKTGDFTSNLTDVQMMSAYRLGQSARSISDTDADAPIVKMRTAADAKLTAEQKTAKQKARIESKNVEVYFETGGTVTKFDEHTGKYDDKRMAAVNTAKFLSKLGIGGKYYFFESYENADGVRVYKDANGNEVEAPNGMYKDADGSIHIDLNAGDRGQGTALFTLGHELTHFVKAQSKKQFKILGDLVTEAFDKTDTSMHDRVVAKQDFLSKIRGHHVTYTEAFEEVVADAMSTMITDGSFHEKIMEIKVKDKGLFNTIKRFFEKMIAKFREVYAELTPDQRDARDIREMKDMFDKIQTAFAEALVEASDNFHAAMESVVEAKAEPISADQILTDGAVVTDGEGEKHSIRSMKADIAEGKMFEDLKAVCGWTDAQVITLRKQLNELVEYMIPYREILDMNEAYGREGRRFSPYKPNSDPLYKISMDFSTLCSKRLLTQYVIENLQLRENRPMSAEEQMAIRDMLNEYRKVEKGLQVACAMCYVEAARLKSPKQMQRWLDDPAPLLKDYFGKKNKAFNDSVKEAQADFKESKGYDREAPKKDMKPAGVKELNKIGPKMRSQYQLSAEEQAIVDRAKTLPNSTYLTAGNLANLSETDPVIYDAYTAFVRTATRSKSLETDEPYYYGDSTRDNGNGIIVSDSFIEAVNRENGMRFSSWSDWRIQHMLDYITAVIDNSVRGAAMHGYTKFGEEVRVLGKTGMMFNMSGVAGTQTGLNDDGSLNFSDTESIDVNEAIQLRNEFPETAGLQCIGVSDEHIVALLRSDIIDYVIPYHVSGLNAALRRMADIHGWKDYTSTQHAAIDKSIKFENAVDQEHWHEEPVYSEFFVGYDTGMTGIEAMRASAEKYKQMCKDRGLTPKFNQFASEENYWKLLIDRKMINQQTGKLIKQRAVTPTFDFGTIKEVVDRHVQNYDAGLEKRALNHIVENWDTLPQRIKDLKKGGTKAKQTKKSVDTLANQTVVAQPKDGVKNSDRTELSPSEYNRLTSKKPINVTKQEFAMIKTQRKSKYSSLEESEIPIIDFFRIGDYRIINNGFIYYIRNSGSDSFSVVMKKKIVPDTRRITREVIEDENRRNDAETDSGAGQERGKRGPDRSGGKRTGNGRELSENDRGTVLSGESQRDLHTRKGDADSGAVKRSDRDSAGKQLSEGQQEFFKDSKARDKKGRLLTLYHGSDSRFTVYDTSKSDDKASIFLTDKRDVAQSYTYNRRDVDPYDNFDADTAPIEDVLERYHQHKPDDHLRVMTKAEIQDAKNTFDTGKKNAIQKIVQMLDAFEKVGYNSTFGYRHMKRGLDGIQSGNQHSDAYWLDMIAENLNRIMENDFPSARPAVEAAQKAVGAIAESASILREMEYSDTILYRGENLRGWDKYISDDRVRREVRMANRGGVIPLYANITNPFEVDAEGKNWNKVKTPAAMLSTGKYGTTVKTREISLFAKENGYDGVIIRNLYDLGGRVDVGKKKSTVLIAFDSNQIKSVDNKNPTTDPDIRYSDRDYTSYDRKAILKESKVDEYLYDYAAKSSPKYAQAYIAYVRPRTFLKLTTDDVFERYHIADQAGELDEERLSNSRPGIYLRIDHETGQVTGHEGRHRMSAMDGAGIELVPVLLVDTSNKMTKTDIAEITLHGQFDETAMGIVRDLIPLNYENRDRVIKNFATQSSTQRIGERYGFNKTLRFSERTGDSVSNRALLANAFEGIVQDSVEYKMIQDYKSRIKELNELETKLSQLNAEIRKIRFGKGEYDAEKLRQLEGEAKEIAGEINRYDKRLLNMEASEPLRKVIERERKKEAQKTKDHVKQIQENKKVRAEQAELRHKIRKTIRDLDKILKHGNKQRNVKEDMKSFASKALELADYLFTDHISNDDLIRKGITVRMTEKEAALVKETEDILSKLYDHADSLTDEEFTRLDAKRKANEDKLRDLLKAQRNERLNTPVYNLFNDLVTEYASLKNSKQDSVKAAYDEVLENSLRAFMGDEDSVKILKNMRVADMTTEELNWLYRAYTMVLTNVRKANKFHVKGITETIEQRVGRIAGDFSSRKIPDKKAAIIARNLANKIGWDYEKLYYALDRIGSEAFTELVMNIANSENTVMQDVMEAAAFRDEMVEKYGFNNWDVNKEIDREFLDYTGKKFKLTLGQLMALYAYSRREGAWDHIEYGGFVFGEAALTNPRPADSYKLSKEQCVAITSLLTKEQKGYAEDMQKYLSETMGEKGNEVSMMLYGIKMFGEKNYFPIHIAGQFKAQANESQAKAAAGFSSMSNAGFTHAQNPNAKAPFVLEGFNEIWVDHVNEMSRYHGTVPALEDMRRVMNRSSYSESTAESMAIKQLMENSYGKEAVEYFDNLYREANSGAITDKLQKNSKKLLSLFRKNSVAYSLSVLIQQPAAMVRAYDLIDRKYFGFKGFGTLTSGIAKAVSDKWTKAHTNAYNEMLKYAPGVTMAKEIGGFDTATGGSIRSYLLDTNKSLSQKWKTGTAIEKGSAVMDLVDNNAVANLPNLADKIAWIEIWNACKRETVAKHKDLATNSEEFMQAVGERFTEVIRATQVYDSIFAKSPMLKSKNLAVQYLVSFMNEPNTVANMVEKAVRDATKGDWKSGAKTAAVVVHSIIFTNVLKSLVYAMRDEDEDETYIEKYIEAVAGNMMSDFNALNYIPIARDVVSLAQGYDVERADMAIVADALDALNRVIKNGFTETDDMTEEQLVEFDKKCTEANWKLVESVAAFFGIPVKNIRREIEGVINTAKNTAGNNGQTTLLSAWEKVYDAVIESIPFMQVKNTKQDKLYEAIMAGDQAYLSRLKSTYKDDSAYQSAVRKALRENDPRIHDAAQAKYEGRVEEYKRIFREIQKEGKFSFDDIMSAVNSEESAIRNKLEPDKATSSYTASDFVESIVLGDSKSAEAMKEDIIATKVANGKTQADAEKEFISSVATGIRDAYSSGLLDEAGAEKMLMEYADKDEEEAASKVGYWGFCEDNPKYDYFTESNVKDYREFAEPENISLEVYAQFINGTKGLADIKDKWGDVEVTKREQVLEVIDSLPLTWQQKDALYLAAGYSESKIWDVPW